MRLYLLELMFDEGSVGLGEETKPISISNSANCLLFRFIIYSKEQTCTYLYILTMCTVKSLNNGHFEIS